MWHIIAVCRNRSNHEHYAAPQILASHNDPAILFGHAQAMLWANQVDDDDLGNAMKGHVLRVRGDWAYYMVPDMISGLTGK